MLIMYKTFFRCTSLKFRKGGLREISSAQRGFKSDASYRCTQIGEVLDVSRKKGKNGAEVSKV